MKKIKVEDSINQTLIHDITEVSKNFKGARFKRGHIIKKEDIPILLSLGKKEIFILEDGDEKGLIHEEEAARAMIDIFRCAGTSFSDISEGKCIQTADVDGFFVIDTDYLDKINSIEDITVCNISNHYPCRKGDKISSFRIIPLYTKRKNIEKALKISEEAKKKNIKIFNLIPYNKKRVSIIITGSEIYKGLIKDRFEETLRRKLINYPAEIVNVKICDDDKNMQFDAIEDAINNQKADLILLTGGMSVDADDITKDSIKAVGAELISYGFPCQPGNMTALAYKQVKNKTIAFVGVPSAAISRPVTVLDVLLPLIFADYSITKKDILKMSYGGLCQSCDKKGIACSFPNCRFGIW